MSNLIEKSVVKVIAQKKRIHYGKPWITESKGGSVGTGFCIEIDDKPYILTNCHCVYHASHIMLKKSKESRIYTGKILMMASERDLAIITVDESFPRYNILSKREGKSKKGNKEKGKKKGNEKDKEKGKKKSKEGGTESDNTEYELEIDQSIYEKNENKKGGAVNKQKSKIKLTEKPIVDDKLQINKPSIKEEKFIIKNLIDEFYSDMPRLSFSKSPKKTDELYAYGYPYGGDNISITRGIINRYEVGYYLKTQGIIIQIDTPINPGNSGGPAIDNQNMVAGVVFAGYDEPGAQNVGYIIPPFVVTHFIKVFQRYNKFPGICSLGIEVMNTLNDATRAYYNIDKLTLKLLKDEQLKKEEYEQKHSTIALVHDDVHTNKSLGIIVTDSYGTPELKRNDIILRINNRNVDSNGYVFHEQSNEMLPYWYLFDYMFPGEKVEIDIIRKEQLKKITFRIQTAKHLVPALEYEVTPRYYILGGLIFVPLSGSYIYQQLLLNKGVGGLIGIYEESRWKTNEVEELIILSDIISSELTKGYMGYENLLLISVNKKRIKNLDQLKEIIDNNKEKYIRLKFSDNVKLILPAENIINNTELIIKQTLGIEKYYNLTRRYIHEYRFKGHEKSEHFRSLEYKK